jgi:hypothetical protein
MPRICLRSIGFSIFLMKYFTFFTALLFISPVYSQLLVPEWTRYQDTRSSGTFGIPFVRVDEAQNVVVFGETYHPGSVTGFIVTKYDSLGNLIWENRLDSPALDQIRSGVLDEKGNVYVGYSAKAQFVSVVEGIVLKYDSATGDTLWSYHYPYQNPPLNTGISKLYITQDQQILVLGAASGGNPSQSFTFLVALDTAGQTIWQSEIYGGTGLQLIAIPDGFVLWGSNGDQSVCWQLDTLGNVLDQHYTPANTDVSGGPRFVDYAGNLYIGDNYGEHKVTKYNTQGSLVWTYAKPFTPHPNPGYVTARAEGINVDNEGNVFFGGMYYDGTSRRHYQTCLDSSGNLLWEDIVYFQNVYSASSIESSFVEDNKYIAFGTYSVDSLLNLNEPFIAIYNKTGVQFSQLLDYPGANTVAIGIIVYKGYIYATMGDQNSVNVNDRKQLVSKYKADVIYSSITESGFIPTVNLQPNPATHACSVVLSNPGGEQPATLEVIDVQGQVLHHQNIRLTTGEQQIAVPNVTTLPNGIYFIRVGTARSAFTRRLVKM